MTRDIAIIGVGCVLPDAPDVNTFWSNLMAGKSSIREIPEGKWNPAHYYRQDHEGHDATYTKIGAFVLDDGFESLEYRIPPKSAAQIDPCQRWALSATRQALRDAGIETGLRGDVGKAIDRDRVAVIVGNAQGGEFSKTAAKHATYPELEAELRANADFQGLDASKQTQVLETLRTTLHKDHPGITEDTMPGHLSNVVAGRIANVFDLRGKNFTTDAACASSLAALDAAIFTLESGDADYVVCGGTDRSMDVHSYVQFSKIGALSPDGSRPFDAGANGFVMGEGCAMFVLKRHADAVRDGDRVYAVIRGVGSSSDGKGKGITAPNPRGQVLAVERAWKDAGLPSNELGYLEAHGTSTPVGDPVELESVGNALPGLTSGSVLVGSVKSNLGHLKAAAGAVGLLKATLAIHHQEVPPSLGVQTPNPRIDWSKSPFQVAKQVTPWKDPMRVAAVSSFGFGGTNFHVILENPGRAVEAKQAQRATEVVTHATASTPEPDVGFHVAVLAADHVAQAKTWDSEAQIQAKLVEVQSSALGATTRIGFAYTDAADFQAKLGWAEKAIANPQARALAMNQGVFVVDGDVQGKVAFLFPGQGTQYVGMGKELADHYPAVRSVLERAREALKGEAPKDLLDVMWAQGMSEDDAKEALRLTEYTQPAVLAMDAAVLELVRSWGLQPDVVAGHSLGEYGALLSAGVLSLEDAIHAVAARGREMAHVDVPDLGGMASVQGDWQSVGEAIASVQEYVIAANKNSPSQTVIAGSTAGIREAMGLLKEKGFNVVPLPVSAAFHSAIVAPASEPLRRVLGRLNVQRPKVPVITNVGAVRMPEDPDAIRDNLAKQVASPVEWIGTIESMYDEGVRIFVEVGPKKALTGFGLEILKDRPDAISIGSNHPKKGDLASLFELKAFLTVAKRIPVASVPSPAAPAPVTMAQAPSTPAAQDATYDALATKVEELAALLRAPRGSSPSPLVQEPLAISGVSFGLPGTTKSFFDDGDFDRLLAGENFIEGTTPEARKEMLRNGIVRLVKDASGGGSWKHIESDQDVIQLAGQRGAFELADYGIDEDLIETLDVTTQYAIAAGLRALRDAGIPLIQTRKKTSQGTYLPGPWKLHPTLGDRTGVIFASAFPGYDFLLKHVQAKMEANGAFQFDRKFLFQVLSMGHSQFAQLIGARGPNTQVNAACASTTQAIGFAEDWIRSGRCDRVIVIGADDATSPQLMPWIGSGFLASGAATTEPRVEDAALPFDRRRHGMIIGMGAVGLVLEKESLVQARGMQPAARLLATQISNSAYHGSRLDVDHIQGELKSLLQTAQARTGVTPDEVGSSAIFMSHETYTPARGGSASAEVAALRAAFGAKADGITIANVKGFTGHPQGAGIEDAIVVRCLQRQVVPPIPNHRETDPELGTLNLSKGGPVQARFAIRLAAGFGSQVAFTLLEKGGGMDRIVDAQAYEAFLGSLGGSRTETVHHRLHLVGGESSTATPSQATTKPVESAPAAPAAPAATPASSQVGSSPEAVLERLTNLVVEQTGYPKELLDPDLDMEADLGIDTVKQAELMGAMREAYQIPLDEGLQIKDYPTLRAVAGYIAKAGGGSAATAAVSSTPAPSVAASDPDPARPTTTVDAADDQTVLDQLLNLVVDQTGYPKELLDPDLDMEADLGIDTVKQAELMGAMREAYQIPMEEGLQIKDYPTLRAVAGYVASRMGGTPTAPASTPQEPTVSAPAAAPTEAPTPAGTAAVGLDEVLVAVTDLIAEQTGYPKELLDPDLDMEADLGIDTVKQAELFQSLRQTFQVPAREDLQLKDYPTIRAVAGYMAENQSAKEASPTMAAVAQAEVTPSKPSSVQCHRLEFEPLPEPTAARIPSPLFWVGPKDEEIQAILREQGTQLTSNPAEAVGAFVLDTPEEPVTAKALFQLCKNNPDWAKGAFLVVQVHDGYLGLKAPLSPALAGVAGFTKALAKEWPEAKVRVLDVGENVTDQLLATELAADDRPVEVALRDGKSYHVQLTANRQVADSRDLTGKHWLVTGGAQGITAAILKRWVQPGMGLTLTGRTKVSKQAQQWVDFTEAQWKQTETEVLARLKEEGRATPVQLRKEIDAMRKQVEIVQNCKELQALGARVLYVSADATDREGMAKAVRVGKENMGSFTGILHAAGVEISKLIQDKPMEQFELIYDIKQEGIELLLDLLRDEPLEDLHGFSSIAARFGNAGQTDYSAGNEALAKAIRQAARTLDLPYSSTICWGPWAGVGMATRGSIMQVLDQAGVEAIPVDAGVEIACKQFAREGHHEVVVAGRLGAFAPKAAANPALTLEEDEPSPAAPAVPVTPTPEPAKAQESSSPYVVLDAMEPGGARGEFALRSQPYVVDHAIDGTPLLPGVIGTEALAELAHAMGGQIRQILDADYLKPVKQHRGKEVQVMVDAERKGERTQAQLRLQPRTPDGTPLGEPQVHFRMAFEHGDRQPLRTANVPDKGDFDLTSAQLYPPFFHGPAFQVLEGVSVRDQEATGAMARTPKWNDRGGKQVTEPMVLEALWQLCGAWVMKTHKAMCLPSAFESLSLHHAPSSDVRLWCQFNGVDIKGRRTFHAAACNEDGTVILRLRGFKMVELPGEVTMEAKEAATAVASPVPSESPTSTIADRTTVPVTFVDLGLPGVLAASVPVVAGIPDLVTDEEVREAAQLHAPKRREEFLAGRQAVRAILKRMGVSGVQIQNLETGQPVLVRDGKVAKTCVSITHRAGHAVAAISDRPIGIDLELDAKREENFVHGYFSEQERSRWANESDHLVTMAWAAKEAVLKRTGRGLQVDALHLEVVPDSSGVQVQWDGHAYGVRFQPLGDGVLAVTHEDWDQA